MPSTLEQLNITYDPAQDRLLLKVNAGDQGEYRVWLTRRFAEMLASVLATLMEKAGGMQDIASHHDTINQLKGGAFDQEYAPSPDFLDGMHPEQTFPLGPEGVLGFRINHAREHSGNIQLQLLPEHGQGINLSLNRTTLFFMYNLLEQGVAHADWKLLFPQQHKEPVH